MQRNSLITNAPTAAFRVRAPTQSKGEPKRKTCQGRNRARPPSTSLASCRLRRLLCQCHPALHEDLPFTKDVLFQRGRHPHADVHLPVWPQTEEEEVDEARPQTVLLQAVANKRLRLPGRERASRVSAPPTRSRRRRGAWPRTDRCSPGCAPIAAAPPRPPPCRGCRGVAGR